MPNVVLNSVLTLCQAPKIFKVSFVSQHKVFIGVNQVNLLEHVSFEAEEGSKYHDPRLTITGRHAPQLSLNFPLPSNNIMSKAKLFKVSFV